MKKIYNFNAGPSMLPKAVLLRVKKELLNWNKLGASVMEISHRSIDFINLTDKIKRNLKKLLNIPNSYKILFAPGGARGQFSAIPMNITRKLDTVDYIVGGHWSNEAYIEAKKFCLPNKINVRENFFGKEYITHFNKWKLSKNSKYVHYCPNETIEGIEILNNPIGNNFANKIIIGDFSSTILSKPINVKEYGIIYASVQKNIGPPGITLIIIKKSILYSKRKDIPSILDYKNLLNYDSMFNTPATFSWYVSGLVIKWLIKKGGIDFASKLNYKKSKLLYNFIDKSDFYNNNIHYNNRSTLNVIFNIYNTNLNNLFLKESRDAGLIALKGHNLIGGMRASIYNSMPIRGVRKLIKFMKYFEKKYG
ncbi:3-phosphoserine/phosphohydroxythreonine transaminase [Buchnera aphidicola (Mollitrichosiphum nigrofasciatum)]|uniref:3-phosphoserine/phosphohydroxythreonine transaminase n=1 Tax=Buchnera aphidicola TaxID=9 RepID=UPI0031B83DAE